MSLLSKLREKQAGKIATATPATFATQAEGERRTVACVATVAVAKSPQGQIASPAKVGAGDTATASCWWLIHYPDRDPSEVACLPEATHAEVLEWHPDAIAAEPFTPIIRKPSAPMTDVEENAIRAWLASIEETDLVTIANVIGKCRTDADALAYFLRCASDARPCGAAVDDRRCCNQCANLTDRGLCLAAKRGELISSRRYSPVQDVPRRCNAYLPGSNDKDRRPGRVRWPEAPVVNFQDQ